MLLLITYDVSTQDKDGQKRLSKVARLCSRYGQRVQSSVFECNIDYQTSLTLKNNLIEIIDKNTDSLRFYNLGNNYKTRVEHIGAKKKLDFEDSLIF